MFPKRHVTAIGEPPRTYTHYILLDTADMVVVYLICGSESALCQFVSITFTYT